MTQDIGFRSINNYLIDLVPPRPAEMLRMEEYAQRIHFPIIGPAAGYFCYQIARMMGARRVFEMGSGFGYSTAWFARAVKENGGGVVQHVVWDEELSKQARQHLGVLGIDDVVQYRVGEAVQALREAAGPFDLIFNDIDKEGYPASLPVVEAKLRPGGVLLVDNMIWHGQTLDPHDHEPSTKGVREMARLLTHSTRWISSIVPIRDGVLMAYKL